MLAELAAFNAAYGTVKAALSAGKEIYDCASQIGVMMGAEQDLKERGEKKQNSMWSALAGKDTNDFEEFMALEKIRTQRAELLQTLALYGRAGLKDDYLKFEGESRKKRKEERELAKEQFDQIVVYCLWGLIAVLTLSGLAGLTWMAMSLKGV